MVSYRRGFEAERLAIRGTLYRSMMEILGANAVIFPLGDPKHGLLSATTFKTYGDLQATVTPSEPLADWDTKPGLSGIIPIVDFNGTDEEADTPDVTFFSRGDGSNDSAFTIGLWIRPDISNALQGLLAKAASGGGGATEWHLQLTSGGLLEMRFRDSSASASPSIVSATSHAVSTFQFVTMTYDGTGGGSAMTGAELYLDGVIEGSPTRNEVGGYVAMENGTQVVTLAQRVQGDSLFNGKMAGGPLGPFFAQKALTADEVEALYQLGRAALNL